MNVGFKRATPVWIDGAERERNVQIGLYARVSRSDRATLRIACASCYQLYINGEFAAYGPARSSVGYFRLDEVDITPFLILPKNHLAIEVHNSYAQSYAMMKQPSFVQAELELDGQTPFATGDGSFTALRLRDRIQRMERFSYQRAFAESWNLSPASFAWRTGDMRGRTPAILTPTAPKTLLPRRLPPFRFPVTPPSASVGRGIGKYDAQRPVKPFLSDDVGPKDDGPYLNDGFRPDELELALSRELQLYDFHVTDAERRPFAGIVSLKAGEFEILEMESVLTGFPTLRVQCPEETVFYAMVSELPDDAGDVRCPNAGCMNAFKLTLAPGEYAFTAAELYAFRYLKLFCARGQAVVDRIAIREHICPVPVKPVPELPEALRTIYIAAQRTFQQNSADLFMDCPHRERAGWLCDSFFAARNERFFTGGNLVEDCFLENFLVQERYEGLPDGMLPMCYPSNAMTPRDYIPNWAMWFVLEVFDRRQRGCSRELERRAESHVARLLAYFEQFLNEDGLLENLEGWIFVEWSKANELVQDVNYPTNMLYAACLEAAAQMYGNPDWAQQARRIREKILDQSFDGQFFHDRALRKDGRLTVTEERTETCQYYAFYFGLADPQRHPELWSRLLEDFGPDRAATGKWPDIYPANAFIGNYLRLDCLRRYGLYEQLLRELTGYFSYMAEKTGTLWENVTSTASCNHGFAAYAAVLLQEAWEAMK